MDNFVNMILLSSKRFEWYLNDFAGLVVNGKYENNTDLLVFYELCDKTDFIRISHNEDSICISGSKNGELVETFITEKNKGFGSYLYYALGFHKKSQEVEMNINEVCRYDGENLWLNGNTTAGLSGSTTYASSSLRMADGTLSSKTYIDEKVSKKEWQEAMDQLVKDLEYFKEEMYKPIEDKDNKKENENMKGFNFDFGTCENNNVRLSMYGMAIKNTAGEWVSYNPVASEIINVDIFNMEDGGKYLFKMPVGIGNVAVGDIIVHNKVPMFVTNINDGGKSFDVIDAREGECKKVIPTKNMFGFDVMTKIVSLFDAFMGSPTADQPFGNMLPFLMMGDGKVDPMMAFMLMNQQNGTNMMNNPMMMYFMMKDSKDIDPMMFMMMGNMMK
jgi:hypothetical protein